MADIEPIFSFNGLKSLLTNMGYHVEAASPYKPIANPIDIGIKELNEAFRFSDDGIFYVDEFGEERQVYLYKRKYHLEKYGKPRYHVCRCETIESFIESGSFELEYRASNTEAVPVSNMDDNYSEVVVENLPICMYCQRMMGEERALASNEFVSLLKDVDGYHKRNVSLLGEEDGSKKRPGKIDVDIFGYTKDWEEISQHYREERNFTCEQCGIHIEEMSDRFYMHVHHVNGNKADNRPANMKCLCIRCHSGVDDAHKYNFSHGANRLALDDFNKRYPNNQ